jgi:hypothetical protein
MSCFINFFKNLVKKAKYKEFDIPNTNNTNNTNANNSNKSNSYDNLTALEQQKECCVCFESIKEKQLVCGHNVHILCILRSRKKTQCPLCSSDISKDSIEHIKNCKNKKCICKNKGDMIDIEMILAHDLITSYINSLPRGKPINTKDLCMLLKRNDIYNYKRIVGLYIG